MKTVSAILAIALFLGACGQPPSGSGTTLPSDPNTTQPSTPGTTLPIPVSITDGIEAIITASAVEQPDGSIELCPPGMLGTCPGIVLDGGIDSSLIASDTDPVVVAVTGRYDGQRLLADAPPIETDYPPGSVDFSSMCQGLQGTGSVDPSSPQMESVSAYATSQPEYAALWFDQTSSTFTIWFKGEDVSGHQTAIVALAEGEPVCVVGGAEYSESELRQASELLTSALLQGLTDSTGRPIATLGFSFGTIALSVGGRSNRVSLPLDAIDAETRTVLAELAGARVVPYPFIELVDASLSELPRHVPAVQSDVDILTNPVREQGGMAALALAKLRYDPTLNCVYITGREGDEVDDRTVPIWPFGYTAVRSPFTLYDYDGVPVGGDGDSVDLGGGGAGLDLIEGNTCGADGAWIVSR